jgi:hypothetical protein
MSKIEEIKWKLSAHKGLFGYDDSQVATVNAVNGLSAKLNEVINKLNQVENLEDDVLTTFKTTDPYKARVLSKAEAMACLLFDIKANLWRNWKHDESSLTLSSLREKISDLFEYHNVTEEDIGL